MSERAFTILVVDDEKLNRNILTELLSPLAKVTLAKDGAQALKKAKEQRPDLILLDIIMPDMDGFTVLEHLKIHSLTAHIPVVFITGLNDPDNEEKGLLLGAKDYVTKPFRAAIVEARIKTQLELLSRERQLVEVANTDALTGLSNRRKFESDLVQEWGRCCRDEKEITLMMADIDFFKQYNDRYGHQLGDETLRLVGQAMASVLRRPSDFVARYGGEEFVIMFSGFDAERAKGMGQAICKAIQNLDIKHDGSVHKHVTVSLGGATILPTMSDSGNSLLKIADENLYLAKKQGRNQVVW